MKGRLLRLTRSSAVLLLTFPGLIAAGFAAAWTVTFKNVGAEVQLEFKHGAAEYCADIPNSLDTLKIGSAESKPRPVPDTATLLCYRKVGDVCWAKVRKANPPPGPIEVNKPKS